MALVKIRDPQGLDEWTLHHVTHTLVLLLRLGMASIVVIDCEDGQKRTGTRQRQLSTDQADRVASIIDKHGGQGSRRLDDIIEFSTVEGKTQQSGGAHGSGQVRISNPDLLLTPLQRGVIPVVAPIAFTSESYTLNPVDADEVVLALARELAISQRRAEEAGDKTEKRRLIHKQVSVDRIIILDFLGGIPSVGHRHESHVFINLRQEYDTIRSELMQSKHKHAIQSVNEVAQNFSYNDANGVASNDSASSLWGTDSRSGGEHLSGQLRSRVGFQSQKQKVETHLKNLDLLQHSLAMLPSSSSAILTTPQSAANSDRRPQNSTQNPGVGTRRQRNPLIHNLLTNKPAFSFSLPSDRTRSRRTDSDSASVPATFVKLGIPVSIVPDPSIRPWTPPSSTTPPFSLSNSQIDLDRLVHLIEDSFRRKLDREHYFSRIEKRLAGIVIAGEYEGGAILTWETPSDRSAHMVPYLDKFAVLGRCQGDGVVADIVFNAIVQNCFPQGLCWRSRMDNPVNKWYFERAKGHRKISDTGWTMFWTTEDVHGEQDSGSSLEDYEAVCRGVVPSWVDVVN